MEHNESEETYALRCTCPAEEHAYFSTLILAPGETTSLVLSLRGCQNFVSSIQRQALETESTSPAEDRQVGLGVLGLANLLRRYGVTYEQFGRALEQYNRKEKRASAAYELVRQLDSGIKAAAEIAKANNMVRAFAIAPTASCSYRSKDLDGFTCTPEIAPPIGRSVDRDSGTFGVETYEYGDVEIASEVGWENYARVANGIMELYNATGLLHGYSFNWWSDMVHMDENFIEEWLASPQTSLYYSLQVMGDVQDKTDAYAALDEIEVDDYLASLVGDPQPQCDCAE